MSCQAGVLRPWSCFTPLVPLNNPLHHKTPTKTLFTLLPSCLLFFFSFTVHLPSLHLPPIVALYVVILFPPRYPSSSSTAVYTRDSHGCRHYVLGLSSRPILVNVISQEQLEGISLNLTQMFTLSIT